MAECIEEEIDFSDRSTMVQEQNKSSRDIATGEIHCKRSIATCIDKEDAKKRKSRWQEVRERLKEVIMERTKSFNNLSESFDQNQKNEIVDSESVPRFELINSKCYRVRSASPMYAEIGTSTSMWQQTYRNRYVKMILKFTLKLYSMVQVNRQLRWCVIDITVIFFCLYITTD